MNKRKARSQAPIKIDIGARAEAKLELKGEVPSSSLGRLVDALTDAIRPFTERRGLRADQIRLQRAEVAIEIAKMARQKLEAERAEPKPIPNKILVPLIERASNEDIADQTMIARWSDLLVSASLEDGIPPLFVQILDQMDGRQARTLSKVMLNEYEQWYRPMTAFYDYYEVEPSGVGRSLLRKIENLKFRNRDEAYSFLIDWFSRPGCYLYYIEEFGRRINEEELFRSLGAWYEVGLEEQLDICCALGVLKMEEVDLRLRFSSRVNAVTVTYYRLTRIGTDFLACCARDDLAELERQQDVVDRRNKELLDVWGYENRERLGRQVLPTKKEMVKLIGRLAADDPAEVKSYLVDYWSKGFGATRRKVTRCQLSNSL